MVGKDNEFDSRQLWFKLLQAIHDRSHLLVVHRIILFCWIECSRMKSSGYHRLEILPLTIITSEPSIACIGNQHYRRGTAVVDGFADWVIFGEPFDILECSLVCWLPFERDVLFGEVREDG